MSTPQDPKPAGGTPEPAESASSPSASEAMAPGSGTPPSLSKDVGAAEPSSEPYTAPPPPAGEWWQPTDAPAGPLGGQTRPGEPDPSGPPATGNDPAGQWQPPQSGPVGDQPSWGAEPSDERPFAESGPAQPAWGGDPSSGLQPLDASIDQPPRGGQQSPPQYPGGAQPPYPSGGARPDPAGAPQYPQGGRYNYPPAGGYGEQQSPQPGGYGAYPPQSYEPYITPQRTSGSQVFSIIGFVCAVIAVLFCPILFGPAGIVLGIVGHNKGEPLGKWAAITAGVTMIIGFLVGFLVFNGDLRT
ncbi:hypothetical protein [Nocardia sp. NPDC057030]|uniref:hypothetical protein n=1 Tax=unclassified Nocardia TaxID=2637762 RepID=UPI0036413A6F